MKKTRKFLSYLLTLALVVSLMSGLGFKAETVKADSSTFNVLEIVPDESMGTFGLLIGDRTLLDLEDGTKNWARNDVQTFVTNFGGSINTSNGAYTCTKFQDILSDAGINKAVHLDTVKPGKLTDALIKNADLIVINQTVPSCFKGYTAKTFDSGNDSDGHKFTKTTALKVFKKIAGVYGTACPYIIDFSMYYSNAANSGHVLENDMTYTVGEETKRTRGVFGPTMLTKVQLGTDGGRKFKGTIESFENQGSSRNSYKLLKLLTAIDPSTFYGLFFGETDGSYGFDEDLNQIFMYNSEGTNVTALNLNMRSSSWVEDSIGPWYLDKSDTNDIQINQGSSLCSASTKPGYKMGWFWAGDKTYDNGYQKDIGAFGKEIGSGSGNGVTYYNKTQSYFGYLTEISSVISGYFSATSPHKVDYHPYRYLIVTQDGIDSNLNRSVIADMVQYANGKNIGLAGGIVVECMTGYRFANIAVNLNETYDGICMDADALDLVNTSAGAAKYALYPSANQISFSTDELIKKFKKDLDGKPISVNYIETPKEYESAFTVGFQSENVGIYSTSAKNKADITKNTTYINSDNPKYRKLKFNFIVSGNSSSTYTIKLYVDVNNDDRFKEDERVNLAGKLGSTYTLGTVSNNGVFNEEIPLKDILTNGDDFAGGFAWKLVIEDSGSARSVSRIGFSALKPDSTEKTKIRILQICPTDYYEKYRGSEDQFSDTTVGNTTTMSHPSLILPMNSEVSLDNDDVLNLTSQSAILEYLDGKIYASVATSYSDSLTSGYRRLTNVKDEAVRLNGKNETNNASYDEYRNQIVYNSSMLYYYLKMLKSYDVDTTRYSVYNFNTKFGGNTDGSEDRDAGQEIFYDKTENKFYNYDDKGQKAYFDLLMLGFGSSMDYMESNAVNVIEHFISNYGTALVGSGTISRCKNNTLGNKIRDDLGMTSSTSNGYNLKQEDMAGDSTLMVTNDTILTHYPYTSNIYLKGASSGIGPYKLNVADEDLVVTYAKYNQAGGNTAAVKIWGYSENNYYLYRVKNTTYCGLGKTRNEPKATGKQLGSVMTPAEVQIVVNAIITAARLKQSGKAKDPYLKCVDPDRNVLTIQEKEPIKEGEEEKPNNYYILWDSVSTDYDALGMAKLTSGKNIIGDSGDDGLITGTYNDANYRTVPYDYKKIAGTGRIVFSLDEARNNKINEIKVNGAAVSSGVYTMGNSGIYNLSIPLKKGSSSALGFDLSSTDSEDQFSFYLTLLNSDDEVLELHKIIMVRRVLYPVN